MLWQNVFLVTPRLALRPFTPEDAAETFACITPTLTRYLSFEPPASEAAFAHVWQDWLPSIASGEDLTFVIRHRTNAGFLGLAGLHEANTPEPELGIWIREDAHGHAYGREAVRAIATWAVSACGARSFTYPVAAANRASRQLVESLGGEVIGPRNTAKYDGVIYRLPAHALEQTARD